MKLPEICIRHPVLSIVLSLLLIVLGVASFKKLEIRYLPELKLPVVTVDTYYTGASAQLMESQVTTPIESAVSGVNGLKSLSSVSRSGHSRVTVMFKYGGNFEQEASSLRDKVSGIRDKLPADINSSTITVGANGNHLMGIGITDTRKTPAEIRHYVEKNIQPLIRQQKGVGSVSIIGSSGFALRIWLDAEKLASYNLTVSDVKAALTSNNVYFPAGSILSKERTYTLVSKTKLTDPSQFGQIIMKEAGGGVIRLSDIARISIGTRSLETAPVLINGEHGIQLVVSPLQSANPIEMAKNVRDAVVQAQTMLLPGMAMTINYDGSAFLKSSIDDAFTTILEAIVLVILVVFLFLGSVRASLIPVVTIPVSLIGVFFFMSFLGFSLNIMSLLGMVLAIGLVVDDAIVMLENIHRHCELGKSAFTAAIEGSREILLPVVAMTLTLVAVYAPLGIMQGVTAQLFKEFAFTLAGAVLISGFVALTLSPMMCSKLLVVKSTATGFASVVDRLFVRITAYYERRLLWCLAHRLLIVCAMLGLACLGYGLFHSLDAEMLPKDDSGLVEVSVTAAPGASLSTTAANMQSVVAVVKKETSVSGVVMEYGRTWGDVTLPLKAWGDRKISAQDLVMRLNKSLAEIPGVDAVASVPGVVNYGATGTDITINLMTNGAYEGLLASVGPLLRAISASPDLMKVTTNLKYDTQEYAITINRNLAGILGVNLQDIADTINAMMAGVHWSDVQSGQYSYPVMVQMERVQLSNLDALGKLYVKSAASDPAAVLTSGVGMADHTPTFPGLVPISALVKLTPQVGQNAFSHFNRSRSAQISAHLAPGVSEGKGVNQVKRAIQQVLGPDANVAFSGKAAEFIDSSGSIIGIFLLALVFIYLVLAAQFGSFWDPLIILFAVPFSLVAAAAALYVFGCTLSIYSEIGLVTLVGLIAKHGILITQFANDLRLNGALLQTAIVQAAATRLRPILMTTSAMVVGALPLALASGPGSIGRFQIGLVIVFGLLFGTFFSLFIVPVIYTYFGRFRMICMK